MFFLGKPTCSRFSRDSVSLSVSAIEHLIACLRSFLKASFLFAHSHSLSCKVWKKGERKLEFLSLFLFWQFLTIFMFSNYFLSFLNPHKLFWFEISLFFWSVAPEKIGKNIFPGWKKIVLLGKIFFLVGKIIFSIFPHEKTGKVKNLFHYFCPKKEILSNCFEYV